MSPFLLVILVPRSCVLTFAFLLRCRSINDELVYETRVKPITSSPIFNAGTERFVKDWRTAHVAVTVKDSRMRENDAVLEKVSLTNIIAHSSLAGLVQRKLVREVSRNLLGAF